MKAAAGAVLIDNGMILLRKPTGGYGGYSWTFSKGRPDPGETLQQAAERETLEETGYECSIGAKLGDFPGTTTVTTMFLARAGAKVQDPHYETEAVQWFDPAEARKAIMTTPDPTGRERDLNILDAALKAAGLEEKELEWE